MLCFAVKGQVVGEGCASKKPAAREIAAHEALKHLNWIEFVSVFDFQSMPVS